MYIAVLVFCAGLGALAQALAPVPERYPFPGGPGGCGPVCAIYCEHGNVMDSNGCPTCQCREEPVCPLVSNCQLIKCAYGVIKTTDRNGCETCTCRPRPCSKEPCRRRCRYGYVIRNGCSTCRCKSRPCPLIKCSRHCPNGYVFRNGCQTCECKPGPICPQVLCKRPCPNGFVTDIRGCQTCQCKPGPICLDRVCLNVCPNGYETDRNGCRTCRCKPDCGPLCRLGCPNGFVKGPDGCPICRCKPVVDPSPCRFRCLSYCLTRRNRPVDCPCSCRDNPRLGYELP